MFSHEIVHEQSRLNVKPGLKLSKKKEQSLCNLRYINLNDDGLRVA
jgi:hypothetical protein